MRSLNNPVRFAVVVLIYGLITLLCIGCKRTRSPEAPSSNPSSSSATHSSTSSPGTHAGKQQGPSLADMVKALQSADETAGKGSGNGNQLPPWKPITDAERSEAPAHIPLAQGLMVTTAISGDNNDDDYESHKAVDHVDGSSVHLLYSAAVPEHQFSQLAAHEAGNERMGPDPTKSPDQQGPPDKLHHVQCARTIDRADLATANAYSEYFCAHPNEHFPGTTAISGSRDILEQLRAGKQVEFHYSSQNLLEGLAALGAKLTGDKSADVPDITFIGGQQLHTCTLHRVESEDLAFPVLFNDQRIVLPALHAMCKERDQENHIYYFDDPDNPITLAFQLGPASMRLQVIKLELAGEGSDASGKPLSPHRPDGGAGAGPNAGNGQQKQMGQQLADKKKVEIYGIYFDFDSAVVRPDSEATLVMIADIMQRNPTWKLNISGHTDNIGGNDFNQQLSQRRAEAVKSALVTRFHIAPERLATAGYGASQPIESNATLEGRARNRRVELERQ